MKCRFWLLDFNEGEWEGRPCVNLWAITEQGHRVMIIVRNTAPYFYYLPHDDIGAAQRSIRADREHFPDIAEITVNKRKLLGKDTAVLLVKCLQPRSVPVYSKRILERGGASFDALAFSTRCILDLGLIPCGWNECEIEPLRPKPITVSQTYLATSNPKGTDIGTPPALRLLAIAQLVVGERGSARPERDPIRAISIARDGSKTVTLAPLDEQDANVLSSLVAVVREFDPDVIVGNDTNRLLWPYLLGRSKANKVELSLGRDKTTLHSSRYGHVSITGRINLDLSGFADGLPRVKVRDFKTLALHYGVPGSERLTGQDERSQAGIWRENAKRRLLIDDLRRNAEVCLRMARMAIANPIQLSAITGLPLDQVLVAAVGFRVDSYLLQVATSLCELIPGRNDREYLTYRGALVQEPKIGVHENIAVLDFSSMYPSLMMKYNLSTDTLIRTGDDPPADSIYHIPEVDHRFRKRPEGFYKVALTELIKHRIRTEQELNSLDSHSTQVLVLLERERALKMVANACYGYVGWAGSRWYAREVAESATALGRQLITSTIDKARTLGLEVIYSDTDSIFVSNVEGKVNELIDSVKADSGLDIRVDSEYVRIIFTEAMKRYAGLRRDGTLDVVGLEAVRSDWSMIAQDVQKRVLRAVLTLQPIEQAIGVVRGMVQLMRTGKVPVEEFVIRKALTKPIEKYRVRTPHVEVAKKLVNEGWEVSVGDKIGYVVLKGDGALFEKAKFPYGVRVEELDVEYYVANQMKPAALRVLEVFGVSERQLGI